MVATACNCKPSLFPDASFVCTSDRDCASGYWCAGGICVSGAPGGGAGGGGGGGVDAGCTCHDCEVCTGVTCAIAPAGSEPTACGSYRCDGVGPDCPETCTSTNDCVEGAVCSFGGCYGTVDAGSPCTRDGACISGHCADAVCCDQACAGQCDTCNAPGSGGTCVPNSAGAPGDPPCAPYLCPGNDAGCATRCQSDNECAGGSLCVDGVCQPLANGSPCVTNAQCVSTYCVDGRCCATPCSGSCDRCDDMLSPGTCVPFAGGSPGNPSCGAYLCDGTSTACPTACASGSACSSTGFCDGGSCLSKRTNGEPCLDATECLSDHCVDGVCCGSVCAGCYSCNQPGDAGNCLPAPSGSDPAAACPGAYACNGDGGCFGSCMTTASCKSGAFCYQNQCVNDLPVGAACMVDKDCHSTFCAQGVCCAMACGGCSTCNSPGKLGTCVRAADGTDPQAACPGGLACNGNGNCYTACDSQQGTGCEPGYTCIGTTCKKVSGQGCADAGECSTGFCTDGVCCNSTCPGICKSCNRPGSVGSCGNIASGLDPDQECPGGLACQGNGSCSTGCNGPGSCEATYYCSGSTCIAKLDAGMSCGTNAGMCLSGFCRDTVCCNTSCAIACQSCNVTGSAGTCTNYARDTDPDMDCVAYACSGDGGCLTRCASDVDCKTNYGCSDAGTCLERNGQMCTASAQCLTGECIDGRCCNSACSGQCDNCGLAASPGMCTNQPAGFAGAPSCTPFVCNGAASCPSMCTTSAECIMGATCMGGACLLPNGAACTTNTQCLNMHCVGNVCCNSACNGLCQECGTGACTPIDAGTDPRSECTTTYCNGNNGCISPCTADAQCKSGNYCNGTSCVAKKGPGVGCGGATECTSGFCTDGVCCNSTCPGVCMTCKAVTAGSCLPSAAGTDPDNECGAYWCNGASACNTSCVDNTVCKAPNVCTAPACGP
jgi:hypothetical protein